MSDIKMERELDWGDSIERESEFVLLPEGDYEYTVQSFERARHAGSVKLPPCNKAVIKLLIKSPEGEAIVTNNLFLHTKTEGMLSAFFASIGQKKKGEPLTMNWTTVPGTTGRCKVGIRTWENDNGEDMQSNEIKRFYPREEREFKAGEF